MTTKLSLIILFLSLTVSFNAYADNGISESAYLLQEAMMQSNADYNKHKKAINHEEFDRADDWSTRDTQAININESTHNLAIDSEFKQQAENFQESKNEISSIDRQKDELRED